jgi:hypothetical protein
MARHRQRTVTTWQGVRRWILKGDRCRKVQWPRFPQVYRPEEEGGWALPQGEFGLDVIALGGPLRSQEQRSLPQLHQELVRRGIPVAPRTVTGLLSR